MPARGSPSGLRVPNHVANVLRRLHPALKSKVKAAVQVICETPTSGKALKDELAGLLSYRVARFRIVYRIAEDRTIEIVAVGPRKTIYEETLRLVQKEWG